MAVGDRQPERRALPAAATKTYDAGMPPLSSDQAREYALRCRCANRSEAEELREADPELKLRQLAALVASRDLFPTDPLREQDSGATRERWRSCVSPSQMADSNLSPLLAALKAVTDWLPYWPRVPVTIRRFLFLWLLANAAISETTPSRQPQEFGYSSSILGDKDLVIQEPDPVNEMKGFVQKSGHSYTWLDFCPVDSDYVCFISSDWAFAFPKAGSSKTWTFRGIRFDIIKDSVEIALLGRKLDGLLLIRQPMDSSEVTKHLRVEHYYLYSPRTGIVALSAATERPDVDLNATYWLTDRIGFGAYDSASAADESSRAVIP